MALRDSLMKGENTLLRTPHELFFCSSRTTNKIKIYSSLEIKDNDSLNYKLPH